MNDNLKKPLDTKLLMIIIAPIAVLFLGYFMFFYHKGERPNVGAYKDNNNAIVIPNSKSDSADKSKSVAYDREKEKQQVEKRKSSSVSESDFFGMVDKMADKKNNTTENTENEASQKPVAEPVKEKVKVVYVTRQNTNKNFNSQQQPEKAQDKSNNSDDGSGNFGIYQSKENISNTKTNNVSIKNDEFYPAYLEEDTKLKANSPVVFVLNCDVYLGGILYKKNSTLFGKVMDAGSYFDIKISNLRGTDGKTYNIKFVVYNENYSRGIIHDGNLNKAVKESGNQTANDATSDLSSEASSANVTNTGTEEGIRLASQAVSNTVQSLTRQSQPTINLYQGYKIYVKPE